MLNREWTWTANQEGTLISIGCKMVMVRCGDIDEGISTLKMTESRRSDGAARK